jgi:hypothetical protein
MGLKESGNGVASIFPKTHAVLFTHTSTLQSARWERTVPDFEPALHPAALYAQGIDEGSSISSWLSAWYKKGNPMKARKVFWHLLVVLGLMAMVLGVFDPLEGSVLILVGSGLVALAALLAKKPQRGLLLGAFALVAIGVGALFGLSALGGVGGHSGHSIWWLLIVLPYPIGWIAAMVGVLWMVGRGWHRPLLGSAALLSVIGLAALILLVGMHQGARAWPMAIFVFAPYGLSLIAGLAGSVLWITGALRAAVGNPQ